jgi:hypothetical protein
LLGQCIEAGRALVIALNKWDGIESDERDWIRSELRRRLQFIDYADIHFISALHGSGVGKLYGSVHAAHDAGDPIPEHAAPHPDPRGRGGEPSATHGERTTDQAPLCARRRPESPRL